ncbi:MAG: type II toxin-antitoxin system Phd/YefM family antitoxin [Candidatus Muirbacterium halophilum]|nr:type II toxin-antitoxin system Phd/YefM family antitoxin [Candidatus Muirbacterium halophilum]MCK9475878.1 type II toxin-antitoxin system Phd/YefM family antitoxin [Candidatus Muirbacterium halophilum]
MPNIRPIKDLRNTNEISEICNNSDEPVFITKNGYGDLVVMSMEVYEKKLALADLYAKLLSAEEDIVDNKLLDFSEVHEKLKGKYGKK